MKAPLFSLGVALAGAILSTPVAVAAASVAVEVQYDDLDLSTAAGMAQLQKRIAIAAERICTNGITKTGTILRSRAEQQCRKEAVQKLEERIAAMAESQRRG